MAAASSKEAEAQMSGGQPSPYPVQPPPVFQGQPPVGYAQAPPPLRPLQAQPPIGFSPAPMAFSQAPQGAFQAQAQAPMGYAPLRQPMPAGMSPGGMVYSGPPGQHYGAAAPPQAAALIRQPVSVAFGAPVVQPGVQVQYVVQQMAPLQPEAPPPYTGPADNVKYSVPGPPKYLYDK